MYRPKRRHALPVAMMVGLMVSAAACGTSPKPTGASQDQARSATYVALGDSYTSFPGNSGQIDTQCERSNRNYPHLVAAALHYSLADMSCGDARLADLTSPQKPGTLPQFDALSTRTRLVMISIGGNDRGLSSMLLGFCSYVRHVQAARHNPCEMRSLGLVLADLKAIRPELITAYRMIRVKAPKAQVIVVGYPQILGNSGSCQRYPLAKGDLAYVNSVNAELNGAVRAAARTAGVDYLDIADASMNHGICSSDPWIAGLDGVPGQASPVHPFASEQQAVATLLQQELH